MASDEQRAANHDDEENQAVTKPISDKQLAANRANAQKSRGPSTPEGKKRSSQSALRDGKWARELVPISTGPFREDPEAFYDRVEEIMADLKPRGTAQLMAAKRAAGAMMRLDRTDRAEAALILETDVLDGITRKRYPDPDMLADEIIDIEALMDQISYIAGTCTQVEERPLWVYLATDLRKYGPNPTVTIKDLWNDKRLPENEEEWKKAAQILFKNLWTSKEDCWLYFVRKRGLAEEAHARATTRYEALMAKRLLEVTSDHVDRPRTAAWTEFNRALRLLRQLQQDDRENPE